jgi:hypothetical protein
MELGCPVSGFPSRYSSLSITLVCFSSRRFYFLPSAFPLLMYFASPFSLISFATTLRFSVDFYLLGTKMFQFPRLSISFFDSYCFMESSFPLQCSLFISYSHETSKESYHTKKCETDSKAFFSLPFVIFLSTSLSQCLTPSFLQLCFYPSSENLLFIYFFFCELRDSNSQIQLGRL